MVRIARAAAWTALGGCAVIHVATFFALVPWIVFFPLFGALGVCAAIAAQLQRAGTVKMRYTAGLLISGVLLFAYSVGWFAWLYSATGGASSVRIIDGEYVLLSRTEVVRRISEQEYREFPNLVLRICSAWLAMLAVFGLMNVPKPVGVRSLSDGQR